MHKKTSCQNKKNGFQLFKTFFMLACPQKNGLPTFQNFFRPCVSTRKSVGLSTCSGFGLTSVSDRPNTRSTGVTQGTISSDRCTNRARKTGFWLHKGQSRLASQQKNGFSKVQNFFQPLVSTKKTVSKTSKLFWASNVH